jgi:peptidoglycan/LPS O-acetylase OafA/YrhL
VIVVLYHVPLLPQLHAVNFIHNGYLFVDFFFVLSGLVITYAYSRELVTLDRARDFVIRRFGRLWPLHAAVLLAFVVIALSKVIAARLLGSVPHDPPFVGEQSVDRILPNLLLIHALGLYRGQSWNIVSWSISTEFFTYALFAALCLLARRRVARFAALLAIVGAVVVLTFSPTYMETEFDFGFFRCMYGFFVGLLVYCCFRATRDRFTRLPAASLFETASLLALFLFVSAADDGPLSMGAPIVFAITIYVFAFEGGVISRILMARPFRFIGARSYSIYMVHFLISVCMVDATMHLARVLPLHATWSLEDHLLTFRDGWINGAGLLVYLLGVAMAAHVTHRAIEQPGRRYFNRLAQRLAYTPRWERAGAFGLLSGAGSVTAEAALLSGLARPAEPE